MNNDNTLSFIEEVLDSMPSDWLKLTTHRLDIYNEGLAKVEFLKRFEELVDTDKEVLNKGLMNLPTAFDYIRLGHPLSCVLEWSIAKSKNLNVESVISFSSQTMPILAILRKNLLDKIDTLIIYTDELPDCFDPETLANVYGYKFKLVKIKENEVISKFDGTTILLTKFNDAWNIKLDKQIDFVISLDQELGSVVLVNDQNYISEIQHVRRRESIAMTPNDCYSVLKQLVGNSDGQSELDADDTMLLSTINEITNTKGEASIGSSGLSIQYAIMMGLIHNAIDMHKGKSIKFIVPPNCYGGTNDQARRVAACIKNVEILDLAVDGGKDMVESIEKILDEVALEDAVPFIIAEIPTNPRVEIPHLNNLREALVKVRKTKDGKGSIAPVFILDQTFCPNVKFLGEGDFLSGVKTISYVSGSKFPSGGLCTAGYCVANTEAEYLMSYIDNHLSICDNDATDLQIDILTKQMPSMVQRIDGAYKNTRDFVNFIEKTLPEAKINFVSEELASNGFTPSVFSLDLPSTSEDHKRDLNLKLINMMITDIPQESKFCVSYGQLKGCYWTIPATSTQGTTKEGDKDYIVRVSISPDLDLAHHKKIFSDFFKKHILKDFNKN